MLRLYYNRQCELPASVDSGPGTTEHNFAVVGFEIEGRSVYSPFPECMIPDDRPVFWVEFQDAVLVTVEGNKTKALIRSKSSSSSQENLRLVPKL